MARSAWLRITSAGCFAGSLVLLFLGGCFVDVGATSGKCENDGNVCTQDLCDADGTNSSHPAVVNPCTVKCYLGQNEGVCTKDGTCDIKCDDTMPPTCVCANDSECAQDDPCATWGCMSGKCAISAFAMDGTLVDPLEDGDCQWLVCRSGAPVQEAHDDEIPPMPDMKGDCVKPECVAGAPKYDVPDTADPPADTECKVFSCGADGTIQEALAPVGKKCGPNMDMACYKDGMCVSCLPAGKDDYDKCKMNSPMMVI